jgi:hypothetical protein
MITGDTQTKTDFANSVRSASTSFIQALERLVDLQTTYVARGYNPGGADAITDGDIANSKITASQLSQFIDSAWLVSKFSAIMNEQTVSGTIAGNTIVDKIRSDI